MKTHEILLAMFAVMSLIFYTLGCRDVPAWHPDGTYIAFPHYNTDVKSCDIALYNLEKDDVKLISKRNWSCCFHVFWSDDGKNLIGCASEEKNENECKFFVFSLDISNFQIKTIATIDNVNKKDLECLLVLPPALIDSRYFLFNLGKDADLQCIDLKDGSIKQVRPRTILFGNNETLYYFSFIKSGETEKLILGRLVFPVFNEMFTISGSKVKNYCWAFIAANPNKKSFACLPQKKEGDILIIDTKGVIIQRLGLPSNFSFAGTLAWRNNILYIPCFSSDEILQIIEFNTINDNYDIVNLNSKRQKNSPSLYQPSFSPNGKILALSCNFGAELILVDLTSPERKVRNIAVNFDKE